MSKMKTMELPAEGMSRKTIKAIEKAAAEYVAARDSRIAMLRTEIEQKQKLIDLMHKHDQTCYVFEDGDDNFTVELKGGKESLKVKKESPEES